MKAAPGRHWGRSAYQVMVTGSGFPTGLIDWRTFLKLLSKPVCVLAPPRTPFGLFAFACEAGFLGLDLVVELDLIFDLCAFDLG